MTFAIPRLFPGGMLSESILSERDGRYDIAISLIGETAPEITATIWQQECIVLQIPAWPYFEESQTPAVVVLISRSAGRPFAYYAVGGYFHHFPPVTWKRR